MSQTWPRRLAEAVPVGVVIDDTVLAKILVWSLTSEFGAIHTTDHANTKGWIHTIADYITADAAGTCTADQREVAARAARAAWNATAARVARAPWDWAAWTVRAAWVARDARAVPIREGFYPALSEYILAILRDLPGGPALPAGSYVITNLTGGNSVNSIASDGLIEMRLSAGNAAAYKALVEAVTKAAAAGAAAENAFRGVKPGDLTAGAPATVRSKVTPS